MNLEIYNNVQNKSKIQTGNMKLKCSVIPKSQPTSWKPKPKPTSSKTPQCPQEPPPLETPTSNDVTQEIIFHKTYQSNSVIDLDNFPKPTMILTILIGTLHCCFQKWMKNNSYSPTHG
jgi:hypothetical protein